MQTAPSKQWHALPENDVFRELSSRDKGLSAQEAAARLQQSGPNALKERPKPNPVVAFLRQFKSVPIIMLIVAALIAVAIGEVKDSVVIFIVILFNAVWGFIQESKAEKAMEALKKLTSPKAKVLRDGVMTEISTADVVAGDVLLLEEGARIPADARIFYENVLEIDESTLTGESMPVKKEVNVVDADSPVADRHNMALMGTVVTRGKGSAVVVATGETTELGKIAKFVETRQEKTTPLRQRLDRLGKQIGVFAVVICTALFAFEFLRYYPLVGDTEKLKETLLISISLAVAIIPEGLPVVVLVTLALGMQQMAKHNAIVRRLLCVETLGCTTVICSDKTGTLTKNQMTVREIRLPDEIIAVEGAGYEPVGQLTRNGGRVNVTEHPALKTLIETGVLCNNALVVKRDEKWKALGDPTEAALVALAMKSGIDVWKLVEQNPRVHEIVFDTKRKMMTVVCDSPQGRFAYVKGAPEAVLAVSSHVLKGVEKLKLDNAQREQLLDQNGKLAGKAYRVLALAYKNLDASVQPLRHLAEADVIPPYQGGLGGCSRPAQDPAKTTPYPPLIRGNKPPERLHLDGQAMPENVREVESDCVFVGMVGIYDPPRQEVAKVVGLCEDAGIKVVMITGDQKLAAMTIAKELGIYRTGSLVVTGAELDRMDQTQFQNMVEKVSVYARALPDHKMRIVNAFKATGHVVAMTGDGVNDAPALVDADIGISMGVTGTDVAIESSDMVLMDDNFVTIVRAVEEGRKIFDNIRRFVSYNITTNFAGIMLIFGAALLGLPLPLFAVQLLWINIMMDGPPAVALGVEPTLQNVMKRRPRRKDERILSGQTSLRIAGLAVFMGFLSLLLYCWCYVVGPHAGDEKYARTLVLTTFIMFQMFSAMNYRSEEHSVFQIGLLRNRMMVIAIVASVLLHVLVVYLSAFQGFFHTVPLSGRDWLLLVPYSASIFVFEELRKAARRVFAGRSA